MLFYFYVLPLWFVCFGTLCTILFWSKIQAICERRKITLKIFDYCAVITLLLSIALILCATVCKRSNDISGAILIPFSSLVEAKTQPEMYRTMIMNLVLFVPLGFTSASCITQRFSIKKRISLTVLFAFILSFSVEVTQYIFHLGLLQTDDILCNTCGAFLGSLSLLFHRVFVKSHLYDLEFN